MLITKMALPRRTFIRGSFLGGLGLALLGQTGTRPELEALFRKSLRLALQQTEVAIHAPGPGWALEMVSSVAVGADGCWTADAGRTIVLGAGSETNPLLPHHRMYRHIG
mgnify:CR=1 FL=1